MRPDAPFLAHAAALGRKRPLSATSGATSGLDVHVRGRLRHDDRRVRAAEGVQVPAAAVVRLEGHGVALVDLRAEGLQRRQPGADRRPMFFPTFF